MMARNGQVCQEKMLPARPRVDPCQHPRHGCGFVHAEARIVIARDVTGIFQRLVTAVTDNRLHAQISEASRVEHGRAITRVSENRSRPSRHPNFAYSSGRLSKAGKRGTQNRIQSLDALRVNGIGVLEYQRFSRQRAEIGHRVELAAVEREILGGGGFQTHHHHVEPLGNSSKSRKILGSVAWNRDSRQCQPQRQQSTRGNPVSISAVTTLRSIPRVSTRRSPPVRLGRLPWRKPQPISPAAAASVASATANRRLQPGPPPTSKMLVAVR